MFLTRRTKTCLKLLCNYHCLTRIVSDKFECTTNKNRCLVYRSSKISCVHKACKLCFFFLVFTFHAFVLFFLHFMSKIRLSSSWQLEKLQLFFFNLLEKSITDLGVFNAYAFCIFHVRVIASNL